MSPLKPISFSLLSLSILTSFGGCQKDRVTSSSNFNNASLSNCETDEQLLEASFLNESILNATQSEYTFISEEPEVPRKIKFTHISGGINQQSRIALTENGNLDRFTIIEVIDLQDGTALYSLEPSIPGENQIGRDVVKVTDCLNAFSLGQELSIEILR